MGFLPRRLRKAPSPGPQDAWVRLGLQRDKELYWGPHPGLDTPSPRPRGDWKGGWLADGEGGWGFPRPSG